MPVCSTRVMHPCSCGRKRNGKNRVGGSKRGGGGGNLQTHCQKYGNSNILMHQEYIVASLPCRIVQYWHIIMQQPPPRHVMLQGHQIFSHHCVNQTRPWGRLGMRFQVYIASQDAPNTDATCMHLFHVVLQLMHPQTQQKACCYCCVTHHLPPS